MAITLPYQFDTTREPTLIVKGMLALEFFVKLLPSDPPWRQAVLQRVAEIRASRPVGATRTGSLKRTRSA